MMTLAHIVENLSILEADHLSEAALGTKIVSITADSRQVVPGSLFIAVCGGKTDGRLFVPEAIERGCVAVVMEGRHWAGECRVPLVFTEDSHAAVSEIAACWYGYPAEQLCLVGITGTNGKTTTSWLIESMLTAAGFRPGVIGTVNYRYCDRKGIVHVIQDAPLTTPDPLALQSLFRRMVDEGVTHVIMEVSSHALAQKRLGRTCFDVALFTNLSHDHLDYHRSMETYFAAKQRLFQKHLKATGSAVVVKDVISGDTDWNEEMCRAVPANSLIRCGFSKKDCQVSADKVVQTVDGFHCQLDLKGAQVEFFSRLSGGYNVLNVLAAAGVGLGLGIPPEQICDGLMRVERIPGRLERVCLPGVLSGAGPTIFVDYAHTPDALDNVLRTLQPLTTRRLICVFGCGGDRDRSKRPQMGSIAVQYANVTIITSDNPRSEQPEAIIDEIVPGAAQGGRPHCSVAALFDPANPEDGYTVFVDRRTAIATACSLAQSGDTVLIAGKGHENYQILGTVKQYFDDRQEAINGLLRWNRHHLLAATEGVVIADSKAGIFENISIDSRTLRTGDVFVALKGESFDGHHYIDAAVQAGAAAVVAEQMPVECTSGVLYIQVRDSLQALGQLAAYRRQLLKDSLKVAAITGSSGKTTVKELVAAIFNEALLSVRCGVDPLLKTKGNFNNLVGLPLSLLPAEAGHRLAVLEMGMNAPGEIAQLTKIADPDIGCINNVHPAHLLGLGDLHGVAAAKGELFTGMRPDAVRVVNCDDPLVRSLADRAKGKQIGFAASAAGRRYNPLVRSTRQVNLGEQGMRFTLHIGSWKRRITVSLHGSHNVSNCLAAAAVGHAAGIGSETIAHALINHAPAGDKRLAIAELPGGLKVVNDAYNANPASMAAGLHTVASFGAQCRRVAALGDMLELGPSSERLHADIGSLVAQLGYDRLLLTGSFAGAVADAARKGGMNTENIQIFPSPQAMADAVWRMLAEGALGKGDWLLIKGSRGMRMEQLFDELLHRITAPA